MLTVTPEDVLLGSVYLGAEDGDGVTSFSYTAPQASDIAFDFEVATADNDFVLAYSINGGPAVPLYDLQTAPGTTGSAAFQLFAGETVTVYVDDDTRGPTNGGGGEAYLTNIRRALRTTNANGAFRPLTRADILPFSGAGLAFYADATDNCSPLTLEISTDGGTTYAATGTLNCDNGNPQTVTVRATDAAGNSSTCTATITPLDQAPPTVQCVAQSATPGANGTVTLLAENFADPVGSSDFCGQIVEYQFVDGFNQPLDPMNPGELTLDCDDIGVVNVTIAGIDLAGNVGICMTTVTLADLTAPAFVNFPSDLSIDCSARGGTTTFATGMPEAFDNCAPGVSLTVDTLDRIIDAQPGDPFCYIVERRFEAVDAAGNVARRVQEIRVTDNVAPEFALLGEPGYFPADTTVACDSIPAPATIGVSDNCTPATSVMIAQSFYDNRIDTINGVDTFLFTPADARFYNYDLVRTYTATDDCGNAATKTQRVRVRDTEAPEYTGPLSQTTANQFNNDPLSCSALLTFDATGQFADCADEQFLTITYNSSVNGGGTGSVFTALFPAGSSTISFTATDPAGNTETFSFDVEVVDTETPTMVCKSSVNVTLNNNGVATLNPINADDGSYDNCAIVRYELSQELFTCADLGTVTDTLFAFDAAGLSNFCVVNVNVSLATAPSFSAGSAQPVVTLDCGDDITDLSLTGEPSLLAACPSAITVDTSSVILSGVSTPFCRDVERTFTATVTATGQTATYVQLIQVRDTEAPILRGVPSPANRIRTVDYCAPTPMATLRADDNCAAVIDTLVNQSTRSVDSAACGFYTYSVTRQFQALDQCGNSSAAVLLQDNYVDDEAPDLSALPDTLFFAADANCQANIAVDLLDYIEDCAAADRFLTVTNNSAASGYAVGSGGATIQGLRSIGFDEITVEATDPCGNDDTRDFVIAVRDETAPQAACDDVILPLDANGVATLLPSMVDENSFDQCTPQSGLTYSVTPNQFTAPGNYTVVFTVTDAAGNSASCTPTVFVTAPLTLSAGTATGAQGTLTMLPITVDNFTSVSALSGIVTLDDPAVATFTGNATPNNLFTQGGSASGFSFTASAGGDTLRFTYLEPTGTSTSLPASNTPLFMAEVSLVGATGTSTPARVGGDGRTLLEATQVFNGTPLVATPQVGTDGLVSVVGSGSSVDVSGRLAFWSAPNDGVIGADVGYFNPTMSLNGSTPSGANGAYQFSVQAGESVTVRPSKSGNAINGVDVNDVTILRQYIQAVPGILLDEGFYRIAADADNNGVLSGNDLLEIQNVALRVNSSFTNNESWRFYPANASFTFTPGGIDVPAYDEEIDLGVVAANTDRVDFTGVKIGDINGTAMPAQLRDGGPGQAFRGSGSVTFVAVDEPVSAGEVVEVAIATRDFADVSGYQFTLGLTDATLVAVEAGELAHMTARNFNVVDAGAFTTLWDNREQTELVADDTRAVTVRFVADRDGYTSDFVSLTSGVIRDIAYRFDNTPIGVELVFERPVNTVGASAGFELSQNRPNPFTGATTIDYRLPSPERVSFRIADATGRVVLERQLDGAAGWQTITLDEGELPASGVYYYSIVTGTTFATRTMTLVR